MDTTIHCQGGGPSGVFTCTSHQFQLDSARTTVGQRRAPFSNEFASAQARARADQAKTRAANTVSDKTAVTVPDAVTG
jgi:hypothetical protein